MSSKIKVDKYPLTSDARNSLANLMRVLSVIWKRWNPNQGKLRRKMKRVNFIFYKLSSRSEIVWCHNFVLLAECLCVTTHYIYLLWCVMWGLKFVLLGASLQSYIWDKSFSFTFISILEMFLSTQTPHIWFLYIESTEQIHFWELILFCLTYQAFRETAGLECLCGWTW